MSQFQPRPLVEAGCFKVGSKVVRGMGIKVFTITALETRANGQVFAKLNRGVWYRLPMLSLAGPNGDGVGL